LLDYYEGPERIRKWYPSKAQAKGAMNELKQQHCETGQNWLVLSPECNVARCFVEREAS